MEAGLTPSQLKTADRAVNWFWPALALIAAALLAIELTFLRYPGLQADEVVFAMPFLSGNSILYSWDLGALRVPIMLVDYLGALKSFLYWPVFQIWSPNVWSIRVPVCAVSICTLLVFGNLVRRAAGPGIAILACSLLASDSSFIFANLFDWGPVSLLLFGTVAVLALMQRYLASGSTAWLAFAGIIGGLSIWYKAAFIFPLAGMTGAFLLCRKQIQSHLSLRVYAIALAAFVVGSFPLLIYNLESGATFKAAAQLEVVPAAEKLMMLRLTLEGRSLEHYMFKSVPGEKIALQGAPLYDLVVRWYSTSHLTPVSGLFPFLVLSLLALPFLGSSPLFRLLLFTWCAFLISLFFMIIFHNAGAGPHHIVLLYPAPQFIVAATAWAVGTTLLHSTKFAVIVVAATVVSNLWLLQDYYSAARRNGFSVYWSDGLPALATAARSMGMPAAILDWGIENGFRIESRGHVKITDDLTPRGGVLYITHCPGYVIDASEMEHFDRLTNVAGMDRYDARTVFDHENNGIYCLFSLR